LISIKSVGSGQIVTRKVASGGRALGGFSQMFGAK